jgi:hypothetical protein
MMLYLGEETLGHLEGVRGVHKHRHVELLTNQDCLLPDVELTQTVLVESHPLEVVDPMLDLGTEEILPNRRQGGRSSLKLGEGLQLDGFGLTTIPRRRGILQVQ